MFNRVGAKWEQRQTIKQDDVHNLGYSVAIYGQHMAVSAYGDEVLTYILDQHSSTWINNGKLSVPGGYTHLSLHEEKLIATVNDLSDQHHPCSFVYAVDESTTTTGNDTTTTRLGDVAWKMIARLTTKGDPLTSDDQKHRRVSFEGDMVFTSRIDYFGKVFVHKLPIYNNGEN